MLSHGGARPFVVPRAHHPRARWAARRLSTSAIQSIREHDLRIQRTPRTVPTVARRYSSFRGWLRWVRRRILSSPSPERGQPRVHGPEVEQRWKQHVSPRCDASHRDRSRRELCPDPIHSDTSCRKLVTSRAGVSHAVSAIDDDALSEPARRAPRTRHAPSRAASHVAPRRASRSATPEVPSIAGLIPVRGETSLLHNLSPACGVWEAGAFSISGRPPL
jgi:hypothetical protein